MIWAISIALIVSVSGNVLAAHWLLRELRVSHQQARARVHELESERTVLIKQVAEARGVETDDPTDPLGLSPERQRDFTIDPATGNTLYADGTVEAPDGTVILKPNEEVTEEVLAKVL